MSVPDYQMLDDFSLPAPDPSWFAPSGGGDITTWGTGTGTPDPSTFDSIPPDQFASVLQGLSGGTPSVSGGGGASSILSNPQAIKALMGLISGGVGLNQANNLQSLAQNALNADNPFGPYRGAAAQQLMSLLANPSSVTSTPGYQFMMDQGTQAVQRNDASRGRFGGGMDVDLLQYGGEFANQQFLQQEQYLAGLAGANISPNSAPGLSAYNSGSNIMSQALAAMGYGVGSLFGLPTAGGAAAGTPAGGGGNPSAAGGEAAALQQLAQGLGVARTGSTLATATGNPLPGNVNTGLAIGGDVLGIAQGLQHGGVTGDVQAAASGINLAGAAGVETGALGAVAGYAAPALALYNFASNWQSGSTGFDALSGAEAGAAVGSVVPGIGTLIGGIIGGVVGGVSSAFGPGREDPENMSWNSYAQAYDQNPASVASATPAQNFQLLAGIFDSRGTQIPFYNQFGRMGENQFVQALTKQINQAAASGQIKPGASAQDIYKTVVDPWINSMGAWPDTNTVKGAPEKGAVQNLLTSLVQNYITGQAGGWTGVAGQTVPGISPYAGIAPSLPTASPAAGLPNPHQSAQRTPAPPPVRLGSIPSFMVH